MKRGTPDHPKVVRLAKVLAVRRHVAVGLLEMLWHLTARYTPAGDVGKWSDDEIATALDWDQDPARLIGAFVGCGLLEPHPMHRLIVHDWPEHADDSVKLLLKRRDLSFVSRHVATCSDINLLPKPLPKPLPLPLPEPKRVHRSLRSLAPADFEDAWNAYGHKENRAEAEKAWEQTASTRPALPDLLTAIARYHATPKWRDGVRLHFSTWLRRRRYADEQANPVADIVARLKAEKAGQS